MVARGASLYDHYSIITDSFWNRTHSLQIRIRIRYMYKRTVQKSAVPTIIEAEEKSVTPIKLWTINSNGSIECLLQVSVSWSDELSFSLLFQKYTLPSSIV